MLYRYKGEYREFRGRVFALGKPVFIDDMATQVALDKEPDFERVFEPPAKVERQRPLLRLRK